MQSRDGRVRQQLRDASDPFQTCSGCLSDLLSFDAVFVSAGNFIYFPSSFIFFLPVSELYCKFSSWQEMIYYLQEDSNISKEGKVCLCVC